MTLYHSVKSVAYGFINIKNFWLVGKMDRMSSAGRCPRSNCAYAQSDQGPHSQLLCFYGHYNYFIIYCVFKKQWYIYGMLYFYRKSELHLTTADYVGIFYKTRLYLTTAQYDTTCPPALYKEWRVYLCEHVWRSCSSHNITRLIP